MDRDTQLPRMSWQLDAGCSDIVSVGRRPDGPGAAWETFPHMEKLHTDLPRVVQGEARTCHR